MCEIIYHKSLNEIKYPGFSISRDVKDFSWGFYCTLSTDQERLNKENDSNFIINKYKLRTLEGLKVKRFKHVNTEWLDFISKCRTRKFHDYDIVIGPKVDEILYEFIDDYVKGNVSPEYLLNLLVGKSTAHQISFNTIKALNILEFEGSCIMQF